MFSLLLFYILTQTISTDSTHLEDTEHVLHMLRTQKELKTEMKEYVADHHKETYMDTAWGNNVAGLGSGLW